MTAAARRVVIVDDHQLLAESLALALGFEGVTASVLPLTDAAGVVADTLAAPSDLVLLDLDLGGDIGDGSLLVAALVAAGRRVLVVSASTSTEQVGRALADGAVGLVRKDVPFDRLLSAVLAATRGDEVMPRAARDELVAEARRLRQHRERETAPLDTLSPREAAVLRSLSRGEGVAALAASSFVSEATVRSQVRSILTKLGVSSQLEAVARAHRSGWLSGAETTTGRRTSR